MRLILPFLKANGLTDQIISEFSAKKVLLVPGAKETLRFVKKNMPSFIVSTSYEHYISALCRLIEFPFENTYCTRLSMNEYNLSEKDKKRIRKFEKEISKLSMIEIPKNASSIDEFSQKDQETIQKLDNIFWKEIPKLEIGKIVTETNPIGGKEKAKAVQEIVKKSKCNLNDVMYIGDSITDAPALKLVKENGGLAVSFNGNRFSIIESDIAVISPNTIVSSVLADVFSRMGKEKTLKFVNSWNASNLNKYNVFEKLREKMNLLFFNNYPQVEQITTENRDRLINQSSIFRKTVRGEAIGKLG